jgi:integrase
MEEILESYLSEHADWSPNTVEKYKRSIKLLLVDHPDLKNLTSTSFREWIMKAKWNSSTQWVIYCAIRGFIRYQYGSTHPALKLRIKRHDSGPQRTLSMDQVKSLLSSFDTTTIKGIRDLALCTLLLDSGLRASEVCRLEIKYLNLEERRFTVLIKGQKWGEGVFSEETSRFLSAWLSLRKARPGINTVFVSVGGTIRGKSLTRNGLQVIMRSWAKQSRINKLSPHDLRRTFATQATRLGSPARILQAAGRWSNITMVERYTRAIEQADFTPYFPVSAALK